MERYIISAGDLFEPSHFGPFDSEAEAEKWATENIDLEVLSLRIVPLTAP